MKSEPVPVAILCSDLHLSSLKPSCRAEDDWFAVQREYLRQLKVAAEWHTDLDIICAGDIFDRWNPTPETINFALRELPQRRMYCVPGQHDLPNHRLDQVHRSGYGTLVEAGQINDISGKSVKLRRHNLTLHGFAWGQEIKPRTRTDGIHLAVIHKYCWVDGKSYPGAPAENTPKGFTKLLKGYDAAVFGDNHKGFMAKAYKCNVINTGGFIRRKSDEINYHPMIGILYSDGTIATCPLDVSRDRFTPIAERQEEVPVDMRSFIAELESLGEHGVNFKEAVETHLRGDDIEKPVKEIILQALES